METNPFPLTAQQAQELHTTGRLTGYREKCEWQPPNVNAIGRHPIVDRSSGRFECLYAIADQVATKVLTPPRDTDRAYAVKEPFWYEVELGEPRTPGDNHMFYAANSMDINNPTVTWFPARDLPDNLVRQHARITDIKLIISEGELWWDMDVEKVG